MYKFNNPTSNGNPFGNFNPITTNNMPTNKGSQNFNSAYQINTPFIEKQDFRNKNDLLHNNVNENLLLEQIIEYNLNIDSEDRSLAAYPNPFNFTVTFGGHGNVSETKVFLKKNSTNLSAMNENKYENKKIVYEGTPGPIINKKFKNVKYLRLDYVILPKTNIIKSTTSDNINININNDNINNDNESDLCECPCPNDSISVDDTDKLTQKYKYLILRINEIKTDNILGTNKNLENNIFILYPDKLMGKNHIMWLPTSGYRNYKNSNLENITRLTFEILTPKGEVLFIYDENKNIINPATETNELIKECINENMQISISIVLKVVENELNTNTKFEY
jgi:hypothetical protein